MEETDQGTDLKDLLIVLDGGTLQVQARSEAGAYLSTPFQVTRTGVALAGGSALTKIDAANSWTAEQTFKEVKETQYSLTGTNINPLNGGMQYKTLTGNTTLTHSLEDGQSVTLMIADGAGYTVTWPTTSWVWGIAPTLPTTGWALIELWRINGVLYASHVGNT